MKAAKRTVIGWVALAAAVSAGYSARAGEADEAALAERIAALSDSLGNNSGAAPFRENMLDGAGRLAEKEVRFRRDRFGAAEVAGDADGMLAAILEWRKLEPGETSQLMGHAADPRTMLALARDVFGHAPEAWWLTIPAVDLSFTENFSPEVQHGFAQAIKKIEAFCC